MAIDRIPTDMIEDRTSGVKLSTSLAESAKKTGNVISVTQSPYNAKLDGITDDSTAIQTALNDAKTNGIGYVLVPYTNTGVKINTPISIPKGVSFIGEGTPQAGYLSGSTLGNGMFTKTYFILDGVTGTTPCFTLTDNSTMRNFGFYYKTVNTNLTSGDVPIFPWTIQASGYGYTLKDLSVMGASHFINLESFERGTVDGIYGLVTKVAFRVRRSRDVSRIKDVHINPNTVFPVKDGATSEYWSTYFLTLLKRDLVIFKLGSADYFYLENIMSYASNKFLHVVPNDLNDGLGTVFDNYTFTMMGNNILADNTKYGLYIERAISFTMKLSNLSIVPIDDSGAGQGIVMTGGATGLVSISNYDSKGTTGQTDKHIVLNSTLASIVDVTSGRFIKPGDDSNRTDYSSMFTVTGVSKLRAQILYSKTNSLGSYKSIMYNSDINQLPTGMQINKFSLEESATLSQFQVIQRDGADVKTTKLVVDNNGGITGGFSQTITNGSTATYDLRGSGNTNGRGKFIVMADFNGDACVEGYSTGSATTRLISGVNASTTQNNPSTLNVYMLSTGILTIQNNLGSDRTVSIMFFPASR